MIGARRKQAPPPAFPAVKTHTANLPVFNRSAFDFKPGDRVIYLVRHPLDVVLSYADYNGRDIDKAIEIMTTSGLYVDDDVLGGLEVRGSWPEHVASWLNSRDCPILLVRYEDLCDQTENCLRDMLDFLQIPVDQDKLRRAVEVSSFSALQEREVKEGFPERPSNTVSGRFFREGRSGQWLTGLSFGQALRLADACGEVMTKLGYTHPRDVLSDGSNIVEPIKL